MNTQSAIIAILGIIGTVEASKHLSPQITGLTTIGVALFLGLLAGFFGVDGLTPSTGLLMAISAVAVDTTANTISNK